GRSAAVSTGRSGRTSSTGSRPVRDRTASTVAPTCSAARRNGLTRLRGAPATPAVAAMPRAGGAGSAPKVWLTAACHRDSSASRNVRVKGGRDMGYLVGSRRGRLCARPAFFAVAPAVGRARRARSFLRLQGLLNPLQAVAVLAPQVVVP